MDVEGGDRIVGINPGCVPDHGYHACKSMTGILTKPQQLPSHSSMSGGTCFNLSTREEEAGSTTEAEAGRSL